MSKIDRNKSMEEREKELDKHWENVNYNFTELPDSMTSSYYQLRTCRICYCICLNGDKESHYIYHQNKGEIK